MTPSVLALDVIDAHHHLCHLSAASYPWLEGPRVVRYHGDDVPLRRDYLLDDYRTDTAELDALGGRLVGSVHVENGAADPLWESRWIDTVIAENGIPSVQVVKVDLTSPTAHKQMEAHAGLDSVRGVRDILNWHPDPVLTHRDRGDLMTDPAWLAGFAALREFGLSFDLQVFPVQLRHAAALAADHAGMPIARDPDALDRWKRDLAVFAAEPNTTVKISALGTNDHHWTVDSIRRIVLDTIEVFGPSRCMFASNFPVDGLYSTFGTLYAAFDAITAGFSPDDRAELVDALRATIRAVHQEQGCRLYAIHDADDGTITMIEKWDSQDDLAAHAGSPAVKALRDAVAAFVARPATVTTMTPLPAGTAEQGEL